MPHAAREVHTESICHRDCMGPSKGLRYGKLWNCGQRGDISRDDWEKANDILEKLHGCGIAHGDLKPDNFVVSEQGHMRLIDLGLAMKHSIEDGHFKDEKKELEWLREDESRR
ncbi:hypothetical protein TWF173_000232 [Orbilia oligospora]|nr:hypothetical protein TWF173_000232 [Orbilia oligospora]